MTRDEAKSWLVQLLLDKVREDQYPSSTQLNLIEESILPAMIPDYMEVLMDKVAQDTYPSLSLLGRLQRAAETLPRYEQQPDS
jgi:hypothetical protein